MKAAAETYTTPPTAFRSPGPFTRGSLQPFRAAQSDFRAALPARRISRNWFTPSIPYWLSVFEEYRLSSAFMLRSLPNLRVTRP